MATQKIDLAKDSTMIKGAQILATSLRKFAPYPKIKKAVRIGRREGRGTSKFITVDIRGIPYARAFDTGSGIHGKLGHTYPITARNAPLLVFRLRDGKLFKGKTVNHPGVAGVNYTKQAKDEARPKIKALFAKEGKEALRLYLRAEFKDFGK